MMIDFSMVAEKVTKNEEGYLLEGLCKEDCAVGNTYLIKNINGQVGLVRVQSFDRKGDRLSINVKQLDSRKELCEEGCVIMQQSFYEVPQINQALKAYIKYLRLLDTSEPVPEELRDQAIVWLRDELFYHSSLITASRNADDGGYHFPMNLFDEDHYFFIVFTDEKQYEAWRNGNLEGGEDNLLDLPLETYWEIIKDDKKAGLLIDPADIIYKQFIDYDMLKDLIDDND